MHSSPPPRPVSTELRCPIPERLTLTRADRKGHTGGETGGRGGGGVESGSKVKRAREREWVRNREGGGKRGEERESKERRGEESTRGESRAG